jgi:hypothetical protein
MVAGLLVRCTYMSVEREIQPFFPFSADEPLAMATYYQFPPFSSD